MKLKSIAVENFKAIDRCKIELTDATALVGPNNAGKSSILQAIHFASRAMAQAAEPNKQSTISLREVEYIPSNDYRELGHFAPWGNQSGSPESKVTFDFIDPSDGTNHIAKVVLKSARNEGISVNPTIPIKLMPIFRSRDSLFSAYIPGLAGIPLNEEMLSKRNIFRKAASGDSNVVLRNILLLIKRGRRFQALIDHMRDIYPGIMFDVQFNEDKDYFIKSTVSSFVGSTSEKPLEFSGTGYLQVLQIFSYLVLFNPRILLIDEPESHLHPTLQTILVRKLQAKVSQSNAIALITTHSPFVARGLPIGSRTIWIDKGKVVASTSDSTIRDALGWGVLDKKVLICTEDTHVKQLFELIDQDEDLAGRVGVFPFDGVSKLGSGGILKRFRESLGGHHKIIVHRDRDCYVGSELGGWTDQYLNNGMDVWITSGSDIEMYFCDPDYISKACGLSLSDSQSIIDDLLSANEDEYKSNFLEKRRHINKKIYESIGGSPSSDDLWDSLPYQQRVVGKELIRDIRDVLRGRGLNEKAVGRRCSSVVASDLLAKLRAAMG